MDTTGNYATPFLVLGVVQVAGGGLFVLLYFLQKRQAKKLETKTTTTENKENVKTKEDPA